MATKATRLKQAAAAIAIPQTREQVAAEIAEIGTLNRELARTQADMNDTLARVKEEFETIAEPRRQRINALTQGVQVWCEANRDTLTNGGKVKSAQLTTGEIGAPGRPRCASPAPRPCSTSCAVSASSASSARRKK